MKKNDFSKMALLGMASGLIALGQPGLEAATDLNSTDMQHLMASKCAAHGCASLTAERDVRNSAEDEDSDEGDDPDYFDDQDKQAKDKAAAPAAGKGATKPVAPAAPAPATK